MTNDRIQQFTEQSIKKHLNGITGKEIQIPTLALPLTYLKLKRLMFSARVEKKLFWGRWELGHSPHPNVTLGGL